MPIYQRTVAFNLSTTRNLARGGVSGDKGFAWCSTRCVASYRWPRRSPRRRRATLVTPSSTCSTRARRGPARRRRSSKGIGKMVRSGADQVLGVFDLARKDEVDRLRSQVRELQGREETRQPGQRVPVAHDHAFVGRLGVERPGVSARLSRTAAKAGRTISAIAEMATSATADTTAAAKRTAKAAASGTASRSSASARKTSATRSGTARKASRRRCAGRRRSLGRGRRRPLARVRGGPRRLLGRVRCGRPLGSCRRLAFVGRFGFGA